MAASQHSGRSSNSPGWKGFNALLFAEEFRGILALSLPLERVAVKRVIGDNPFPRLKPFGGELIGIDAGERLIHEVLRVVRIAALSYGAEQNHRFRDEDAPRGCFAGTVLFTKT